MSLPEKPPETSKEEWLQKLESLHVQRSDMNRLIMNYLVTEGFKEAAERFEEESGLSPPIDLSTMDNRIQIRQAIQNGRTQEATLLVNQLHPELLDNDRYLYFHLQQLHLIELIREGKVEEAVHFAQSQLSESGESEPAILRELERTLALLAFEDPTRSPFADLLDVRHRHKVASEVNTAILKTEHEESTQAKLYSLVRIILWAEEELTKKKVRFPRLSDISGGQVESPK